MNTRQLSLFAEVARSKSISEAAARLHVSQPAISMQLKRLEEEWGITLFLSHSKGIMLTDAGRHFLAHTERILAMEEQMRREMNDYQEGRRGELIVGAAESIATYLLPPILAGFQTNHAGIKVELRTLREHEIEKAVKDGQIDLGVACTVPHDHAGLRITRFRESEWVMIESPQDVGSQRCYLTKETPFLQQWSEAFTGEVIYADTTEAVKQRVLAGLGCGIVLAPSIARERRMGLFKEDTNRLTDADVLIHLLTRPAEKLAKSLWLLLDHFCKEK
ncbi:LysR family transcriptional regulator [Brevibacillus migulae]|uniref:LysR family transcriptional regulator n=1 Tax=Brevibacillus migulae TaxID=1644114 RepID=UPI00106DD626|nr:LysR family transcriptional regulator [Brevibacillus migulae]